MTAPPQSGAQKILLFLVLLIALVLPVAADGTPGLVPSDILAMETPGHFTLSYDGANLLYIRSTGTDLAPPQNNGTLMYIDVRAATERPLSGPAESVTAYALAPDGNTVVYAAMPRAGGPVSMYRIHVRDSRAYRLDNTTDELAGDFAFLGNDRLIFTGAPAGADPGSSDVIVADEPPAPVILKTYSLGDHTITPLTANNDVITIWAPSPDGRYVLYKAAPDPESWQAGATFRYVLLDTQNGQERELFTSVEGYQDTNQFAWSPDSTVVYIERFVNGGLRYPVQDASYLQAYTPATRTLEEIPLGWDRGLFIDLFNEDIEVNPFNGGAYLLLADGTNPRLARAVKTSTGWQVSLMDGRDQGNIYAIESDRTGSTIVYNRNSASSPPQLFRAGMDGNSITNPVQLTRLNPDLVAQDLGTSEVTSWNGARGETVSGVVRYPPGYVQGNQYPLVLVIHGGPNYADFDSWRDTWEFPYHLITDKGAVTLSVNYHGSTNFGLDFARSIENAHYYDLPVEDLRTGIEHLVARGIVNRSQIGVTGWSNGGILSLALVVNDPTIRAAVSGAGSADDFSQVANTNGIVMNKMYYNKSPYEDPQAYLAILPVFQAEKRRTPLLMMIGTDDIQVDPAGAWVTYRAYKEGSPAPIRFLLFQNQPHHMTTMETQNRKVQEELAWLDRYLLSAA
ncbi:MAG TPA: prolyl oligopeptidase family serine peptidase [Methanolinea sp.]|jgi:dipeptidyl aminopeptidase/acylaminoacyl peptidase|nr:prolyl oligopeptidase family serine peptidase [Methanolinea sp.]HPC56169.1 prolyl oligopeptidase family serine peptidase [Methanolinea sp.]HQE86574.1 prolyl oligopeptidase family serine peptidase [Methanolinea sp.]HQI15300.1 prolyl oligopeptidase family serine peptidase [Methanolinea sp.]HRU80826.1 prolyl oligopeptidase family serine peptidase [Methanolinea sp.]